jgi:hypothetical protein
MKIEDYGHPARFVHDAGLAAMLYIDRSFDELFDMLLRDDFLKIDPSIKVPFFALTRDYMGASLTDNPEDVWIVKPLKENEIVCTEMATICFFIDFYTGTLSAPIVITRIDGVIHKATKLIDRAEQLSGANYTEHRQLREQLLLDVINRWIYFDEDRNPNNYMVLYNSRNDEIVVAIDFLNVDLLSTEMKVRGMDDRFGWERQEKTRYLTPLKTENFLDYNMDFYDIRFSRFRTLDRERMKETCRAILRYNQARDNLSNLIAENLLARIEYLRDYFETHLRMKSDGKGKKKDKYREMGATFNRLYTDGS